MPNDSKRHIARLRARFEERTRELATLGFVLKGSLIQTRRRCSSRGCGCQSDPSRMHGPYWQWTSKVDGKTVTRTVSEAELPRYREYREWMENAQRFEEVARELYELSLQANELLRAQDRQPELRRPARARSQ